MTPHEHAAHLFEEARQTGLDYPTEDMVSDAINDAMDNAVNACITELNLGGFRLSAKHIENMKKRMYDGEHVLFKRP